MKNFIFCAIKMRQRIKVGAPVQNSKNAPALTNLCAIYFFMAQRVKNKY